MFFLDVKMSFLTNVVESVCVCRMITRVSALESLDPEDTFSIFSHGLVTSRKFSASA